MPLILAVLLSLSLMLPPQEAPPAFLVYGLTRITPLNLHRGIWYDVAACLNVSAPPPETAAWAIADSIISEEEAAYAYGMTSFVPDAPPAIILERAFMLNSAVISHEVIHVLTRGLAHDGASWACVMDEGIFLPRRNWTPPIPPSNRAQ